MALVSSGISSESVELLHVDSVHKGRSEVFILFTFPYRRFKRSQVLFANTLFQCIGYHPEEFHILTGGSDRKIAYWESYDGAQIRELEASKSGTINGLDVDASGNLFVTASSDKLVKVTTIYFIHLLRLLASL